MSADEAAPHPDVGSLAEEATALLGALSGWVRENAGADDGAHAETSEDDDARAASHDTGCRGCPVCRVLSAARRPEVRQHLLDAGTSLLAAFAALLETPTDPAPGADASPESAGERRVTRIPVQPEGHAQS